jgi:predicted transcriptional regulator
MKQEGIRLKKIDELILDDIKEHPGTSQNKVIERLSIQYRGSTYVYTNIKRLIANKLVKAERVGNAICLTYE